MLHEFASNLSGFHINLAKITWISYNQIEAKN